MFVLLQAGSIAATLFEVYLLHITKTIQRFFHMKEQTLNFYQRKWDISEGSAGLRIWLEIQKS